jgi:hypothetical protein
MQRRLDAKPVARDAEPIASSPQEFGSFLESERSRWAKVIREANIKPRS